MSKYVKYVHPTYTWDNRVMKQLVDGVYLDYKGKVHYEKDLLDSIDKYKLGAPDNLTYGILEDDGSYEIEFRNKLYDELADAESTIASAKVHIQRIKEIGGIQ